MTSDEQLSSKERPSVEKKRGSRRDRLELELELARR